DMLDLLGRLANAALRRRYLDCIERQVAHAAAARFLAMQLDDRLPAQQTEMPFPAGLQSCQVAREQPIVLIVELADESAGAVSTIRCVVRKTRQRRGIRQASLFEPFARLIHVEPDADDRRQLIAAGALLDQDAAELLAAKEHIVGPFDPGRSVEDACDHLADA